MTATATLDEICERHGWTWYAREPAGTEAPSCVAWLNAGLRLMVQAPSVAEAVERLAVVAAASEDAL